MKPTPTLQDRLETYRKLAYEETKIGGDPQKGLVLAILYLADAVRESSR